MTRDEVRKLADLAGWTPTALAMATEAEWSRLERFAELIHGYVVYEEREACENACVSVAKDHGGVAEGPFVTDFGKHTQNAMAAGALNCVAAIRARSAK